MKNRVINGSIIRLPMRMRSVFLLITFISFLLGQDYVITLDGKELPGKYISHNLVAVKFNFDDTQGVSTFRIDNISGIKLKNGEMLDVSISEYIKVKIIFSDGHIKQGYLESKSLKSIDSSFKIKFKKKLSDQNQEYSLSSINFIKSWNEKRL